MTDNPIDKSYRDPQQKVSLRREIVWAVVAFVVLIVARLASIPLAGALGLDESNQYLLLRPIGFLSDWTLLTAAVVAFIRIVFGRTLGHDLGTRFNACWNSITDPATIIWMYLTMFVGVGISMALLLGLN